jgi:hypothetical protein
MLFSINENIKSQRHPEFPSGLPIKRERDRREINRRERDGRERR